MDINAITRRDFLRVLGAGSALTALGCDVFAAAKPGSRKPNIVLIYADDLGYADLGCQGCKDVPTPNIDSIAKNGVRFTNGYVSAPVCSPSRAGLMTGRYQQRFGHEFNPGPKTVALPSFGLPRDQKTLAERLKAAGYKTGLVGKWHLGFNEGFRPTERGFDEFFGFLGGAFPYFADGTHKGDHIIRGTKPVEEKEYLTDAFAREAVDFIEKHQKEPFFLYLAFNAVHGPLLATDKRLEKFAHITNNRRRKYAAMLSAMDESVGKVLETLGKHKLDKDTLVFFISDNGGPTQATSSSNLPLSGHKKQVWEGGIRIPFLAQWKGHLPSGKVYDNPVISLDVVPTALAAAGVKSEAGKLDGVNLVPIISGKSQTIPHDVLYWRFGEQAAVRKGNWKLIKMKSDRWELYDLSSDISEKKNLAMDKPDKVKELSELFEKWNSRLVEPKWDKDEQMRAAGMKRKRKRAADDSDDE